MNRTTMDRVSDRELVISRTFRAPTRIVFDAWTKPEFVRRWFAPKSHGVSIEECEADIRAGGAYRYVFRQRSGEAFAFSGTYKEVTPHSRLVYTQAFEPTADPAEAGGDDESVIVTATFEERNGQTLFVSRELYPSKEVLEMVLATGMEHGMRETMDQLDELVASLA